ncbi:hypothetical protein KTN05_06935 [Paracoccus sp. Z118]|uniref:DUF6508 domain-containing protein n=1 Tax=Paracoccus sp. Z118 TaxID=2851017 RepID=UPI001C2BC85D|nr:hypothetical protein [Paracoccus sp. Z118]
MTPDDLLALAAFADRLDEPAGEWRGGERDAEGAIQMPWFEFSPMLSDFHKAAYDHGLVVSFDWSAWMQTDEGRRLMAADRARLTGATLEELQWIVTAIMRIERFSEGAIASAWDDGRLPAIILRLVVLAADD